MGRLLSRYIAWQTLKGILLAFVVVTGIIVLVDYVEASRNLGNEGQFSSAQLLGLTLLKTPSLIEQTVPFMVLFGVMGALFGMNRKSELIVLRAAGLSAWRFLRPAFFVSAALGLLWAAAFNPLAAKLQSQYQNALYAWSAAPNAAPQSGQVWLREGSLRQQRVIRAARLDLAGRSLTQPTFYEFSVSTNGATQFARRFDARTARLVTNGYWQLEGVIENAPGERKQVHSAISLPTQITLVDLGAQASAQTGAKANSWTAPPFWALPATITQNRRAGFSTRALEMRFHRLLSLPVMLVAMTFIAAGVSMKMSRQGGAIRLLITGAALGFGVFFIDSVISAFGEVAVLPVWLASWSVPIIVGLCAAVHLSNLEDG